MKYFLLSRLVLIGGAKPKLPTVFTIISLGKYLIVGGFIDNPCRSLVKGAGMLRLS